LRPEQRCQPERIGLITQSRRGAVQSLRRLVARFVRDDNGPTAVEYAVMLALIIVVCVSSVIALGSNSSNTYSYVATKAGKTGS
jgi:pilus assembly protein Flp/PilA